MQTAEIETKPAFVAPRYTALRDGDIVSIRIQDNGTLFKPDVEKGRNFGYLHFARPVAGGMLNCHLHGDNPSLYKGRTIRARAVIVEKILADGRKFVILDLFPVEQTTPITARLVVHEHYDGAESLFAVQLPHAPRNFLHILPPGGKLPPM